MVIAVLAIVIIALCLSIVKLVKERKNRAEEIKWKQVYAKKQEEEEKQKQLEIQKAQEFEELKSEVFKELGLEDWYTAPYFNETVTVENRENYEAYDPVEFFKGNREKLGEAESVIKRKNEAAKILVKFLKNNHHADHPQYERLVEFVNESLQREANYRIQVQCLSDYGNFSGSKEIAVTQDDIHRFQSNPMLLLTTVELQKIQAEKNKQEYQELKLNVAKEISVREWYDIPYIDACVTLRSRQALDNYDEVKFFKQNKGKLDDAERTIREKHKAAKALKKFLEKNDYTDHPQYKKLVKQINAVINNANAYRIEAKYVTTSGNCLETTVFAVDQSEIDEFREDPSLLMTKGEYSKFLKDQEKEAVNQKQHEYYERVNDIIDCANTNRDAMMIKDSQKQLDVLISQLLNRTVNSIKKIKTLDSEEWEIIWNVIIHIQKDVEKIVGFNQKILDYYNSPEFRKIKDTCKALMNSQREFNEYINEKVQSISRLFGTKVVRSETLYEDEYHFIRPYKKVITPFTAQVSATVFESAENDPLKYVVKNFYPNKSEYPQQIEKLYQLVEELETLKDAKKIIENYKAEYQQYLTDVPAFIMENDEAGFYSRLGFANIDESVLTVEYQFVYTSGGGLAQRSFSVPMTEETIVELIRTLESKLTATAFAKEQRTLMTKKLRDHIKERDDFTCQICHNSTHVEPNLLLEIDHIIPVSKGGRTEEGNLQTLCWKCNRAKSNKILN